MCEFEFINFSASGIQVLYNQLQHQSCTMMYVNVPGFDFNFHLLLVCLVIFFPSFIQVKSHKDLQHFETAYVVKLHSVARLSPSQPVSFMMLFEMYFAYKFPLIFVSLLN